MLGLLCVGHTEYIKHDMVGWRVDGMAELVIVIHALFGHQNILYARLGLPEEINKRISQELAQLSRNTFYVTDLELFFLRCFAHRNQLEAQLFGFFG